MTAPAALHKRPIPSGYTLAATCACGITHDCATTSVYEAADRLRDAGWLWTKARKGWTCPECFAAANAVLPRHPKRKRVPALPTRYVRTLRTLYWDGTVTWIRGGTLDLNATFANALVHRGLAERRRMKEYMWYRITPAGIELLASVEVGA